MSFRTRLTSFFLLIVAVPMVAIGVLVFRLISDSEQGKADARAAGISTAAASLYANESAAARADAATLARNPVLFTGGPALSQRLSAIASQAGLARITVRSGQRMLADVG